VSSTVSSSMTDERSPANAVGMFHGLGQPPIHSRAAAIRRQPRVDHCPPLTAKESSSKAAMGTSTKTRMSADS
jgi:hypothetical protein